MTYKILIAEDDPDILDFISLYLENSGYHILTANDGKAAYQLFLNQTIDLAILDLMMPEMNGYDLIKKIREKSNIPIIILSAKREDVDKILGLDIGADDYMTKPFNPLEIVSRVKANLRRYYNLGIDGIKDNSHIIRLGELMMDSEQVSVKKNGQPLNLTLTEFKILQLLMKSPGQIFTKSQIYEQVNGHYFETDDNTMMVHIFNLREKIEENAKQPKYIKTVRGVGYKIEKDIQKG